MAATNPFTGLALTPEALNFCLNHSDSEVLALLLGDVKDAITGAVGIPRAVAATTATANGTVAAGAKYVSFILSSDFAGTIAGAAFSGADDAYYDLPLLLGLDTYSAITYTISAGSARITRIA